MLRLVNDGNFVEKCPELIRIALQDGLHGPDEVKVCKDYTIVKIT